MKLSCTVEVIIATTVVVTISSSTPTKTAPSHYSSASDRFPPDPHTVSLAPLADFSTSGLSSSLSQCVPCPGSPAAFATAYP